MKIGITGQNGFIGWHLSQTIKYIFQDDFQLISFERDYFLDPDRLDNFVSECDVIVHLAGVNRARDEKEISKINKTLSKKLTESIGRANFKGKLVFSSSSQEEKTTNYGISKKIARETFISASNEMGFKFTGLIIPNVFGPFCKPNYNSFIATFCDKIINKIEPKIIEDNEVELIYVGTLVEEIIRSFKNPSNQSQRLVPQKIIKVSQILQNLELFYKNYVKKGEIPSLDSAFDVQLFNTFRSYLKHEEKDAIKHKKNSDHRGNFSEIIRTQSGGQFSYSTTQPNRSRGNHFHTRKVERFSVIQGDALIQLRKIGSKTIYDFILNGEDPSYVDIPVWYTHNVTNIGNEPLITLFWINEPFDEKDPDTYFEIV